MTTANYVVHFDIIETATGALVSHGSCWSSEVEAIELAPGQAVQIIEDKATYAPTGDGLAGAQVSYAIVRKLEYPSLEEQIGAIWKVIATLPAKNIPAEALDILKRLNEVKTTIVKGAMYEMNDGTDASCCGRYKKVAE